MANVNREHVNKKKQYNKKKKKKKKKNKKKKKKRKDWKEEIVTLGLCLSFNTCLVLCNYITKSVFKQNSRIHKQVRVMPIDL